MKTNFSALNAEIFANEDSVFISSSFFSCHPEIFANEESVFISSSFLPCHLKESERSW